MKLFFRKTLLFLICGVLNAACFSQRQVDSLKKIISNNKQSIENVNCLNLLAKYLTSNDPNSSIEYALKSVALAKKLNYQKGLYAGYRSLGVGYMYMSDYKNATSFLDSSATIADILNDNKLKAEVLMNKGSANFQFAKYDKALSFYFAAVKLFQSLNDISSLTRCYHNIANVFYYLNNIDEALNFYKQAESLAKGANDNTMLVNIYNGLGAVYANKKLLTKALEYFNAAEKLNSQIGNKLVAGGILNNIASIYFQQKKYPEAIIFFKKFGQLSNLISDKKGIANSYGSLGECYFQTKDYENAFNYFNLQMLLADSLKMYKQEMTACQGISQVYEAKNDYKSALKYYQKAAGFKDSLSNQTSNLNIARITAKLENEKADKEKELKQKTLEAEHQAEIKKQKIIIWSVIIALVLSFFLLYFIFRNFSQKKKANILLANKNKIIEEKNKDITDSITYAKRIQEAILPPHHFVNKHLPDNFILYKPKDIVAGDFYWCETVNYSEIQVVGSPNDQHQFTSQLILIAAADCTGHGVPGAMVSVVCSNALNRAVKEFGITDPGRILDKTRDLVLDTFAKSDKDVKDGMDISLISIHHVPGSQHSTVKWAGANNPLWFVQDLIFSEIVSNKQPIGKTDNPLPFTTHAINLKKGSSLYLFTDGYPDQFGGPAGKKFKYKQFKEVLAEVVNLTMNEQSQILNQKFEQWKGALEQVDDVCIIGIKI